MAKRRILIIIILAFIGFTVCSQEFPPPTNFYSDFNADSIVLNWEPPTSESLLHYNIYYYGYIGGQIIHAGSTTETSFSLPKPSFLYSINLGLSAEYTNPVGESDTIWSFIGCPELWIIPIEISFEDYEYYFGGMVANIMQGSDNWELTDTTSYSPDHSVGFISDSLNYKSALVTTVIESYDSVSPTLSFMYKIPQKQGKTDTLKLCYYSFLNYFLLTDSIYPTDEWQEYQYSLETLPNSFHFAFEATSGGGGGVFLDDIIFYDNTVNVQNNNIDLSHIDISINQNGSSLDLSFTTIENTQFKTSIYSIDGRLAHDGKAKNLSKGNHQQLIDISALIPGLYIIKVNLNNKIISQKVFIN